MIEVGILGATGMVGQQFVALLARHLLDAQGLVEVSTESLDRSGDVGCVASLKSKVAESATLRSNQESVENFPRDQRLEDRHFGR